MPTFHVCIYAFSMIFLSRPEYYGGMYELVGLKKGGLPARSPLIHVDVFCKLQGMRRPKVFFAVGPHTHKHGTLVTGYLYRNEQLKEIARHDPQMPQRFYPMERELAVDNNDYIGARCTFNTTSENRTIYFGNSK